MHHIAKSDSINRISNSKTMNIRSILSSRRNLPKSNCWRCFASHMKKLPITDGSVSFIDASLLFRSQPPTSSCFNTCSSMSNTASKMPDSPAKSSANENLEMYVGEQFSTVIFLTFGLNFQRSNKQLSVQFIHILPAWREQSDYTVKQMNTFVNQIVSCVFLVARFINSLIERYCRVITKYCCNVHMMWYGKLPE